MVRAALGAAVIAGFVEFEIGVVVPAEEARGLLDAAEQFTPNSAAPELDLQNGRHRDHREEDRHHGQPGDHFAESTRYHGVDTVEQEREQSAAGRSGGGEEEPVNGDTHGELSDLAGPESAGEAAACGRNEAFCGGSVDPDVAFNETDITPWCGLAAEAERQPEGAAWWVWVSAWCHERITERSRAYAR